MGAPRLKAPSHLSDVLPGEPPCLPRPLATLQEAPISLSPTWLSGAKLAYHPPVSVGIGSANTWGQFWVEAPPDTWSPWAAMALGPRGASGWLLKAVSCPSGLPAESGQSSGQFQGRPSEVWSQWQSQHHGQQSGEQHSHQQPGQTEVFQVNRASTAFPRYRCLSSASSPRSLCGSGPPASGALAEQVGVTAPPLWFHRMGLLAAGWGGQVPCSPKVGGCPGPTPRPTPTATQSRTRPLGGFLGSTFNQTSSRWRNAPDGARACPSAGARPTPPGLHEGEAASVPPGAPGLPCRARKGQEAQVGGF